MRNCQETNVIPQQRLCGGTFFVAFYGSGGFGYRLSRWQIVQFRDRFPA
jgi:hypothetical protein